MVFVDGVLLLVGSLKREGDCKCGHWWLNSKLLSSFSQEERKEMEGNLILTRKISSTLAQVHNILIKIIRTFTKNNKFYVKNKPSKNTSLLS